MIDLHGQAGLPYVKKGVYTGSYQGMRYRLCKKETAEKEEYLEAAIYPEPLCFEATPEEEKSFCSFPLTEEGFGEAIDWLNREYEAQKPRWQRARTAG